MTTTTFPPELQRALDAEIAERQCDIRLHPRTYKRLSAEYYNARKALTQSYPQIEEWLFGYPYRDHAKRLDELKRLLGVTP